MLRGRLSKWVFISLALCLSLRFAFFAAVRPWDPVIEREVILASDSSSYQTLALNLKNHHRFTQDQGEPPVPETFRTPLYPAFIGLTYWIFGERVWIVIVGQIVLSGATLLILFLTLSRWLDPKETFFASLFYSVDPFLILYSNTLLTETFFIFFLVCFFYFFSSELGKTEKNRGKIKLFLAGMCLGLSALTRPSAQFLLVPTVIFLLFPNKKNSPLLGKRVLTFILGFFFIVSPWLVRNLILFDSFSLSTANRINLLNSYVGPMFGEIKKRGKKNPELLGKSISQKVDALIEKDGLSPSELNPFERSDYTKKLAFQYIRTNPTIFVEKFTWGVIHSLANLETRNFSWMLGIQNNPVIFNMKRYSGLGELFEAWWVQKSRSEKIVGMAIALYLFASYAFLLVGFIVSWKLKNPIFLAFCLTVASFLILMAGPIGLARYRLPAVPFYLCFIGIGVNRTFTFFKVQN